MSKRPRQFEPGETIISFDGFGGLEDCLTRTGYVFIFGDQPKHAGFVRSLKYITLLNCMKKGVIRRAAIRQEWVDWMERPHKVSKCADCDKHPAETGWNVCVGCHAYREHTGQI